MVAQSQRPILNRLLACDPLETPKGVFFSVDEALMVVPPAALVRALDAHGVSVSERTLKYWKKEIRG